MYYRTVMTSKKKWSTLWNYFEELNSLLVKCTTCKKKIKISYSNNRTPIMRAHLFNVHGIFLDDDTLTLPDDLKQYYSELPEYKAKCNDCSKIFTFLRSTTRLRVHLRRRHSIKIQSRNKKASKKKRSKLWNYFEELKPSLVKCTTCKKEIKVLYLNDRTKIMRAHLLNKHGISLDDDTRTLPDDLKQYYSELPGYKAKCKDCGKTVSFLTNITHLRKHLRRHSIRTQNRDKPSTSRLADNGMDLSAERQGQDSSGLPVQSFKEATEKGGAFNEPSTSITTGFDTNPTAECQSQETVDLDPQTCEQSQKETRTVMTSKKKWSTLWNYFEELNSLLVKCTTCKKKIKISYSNNRTPIMRAHLFNVHGIFLDDDTLTLPDDLKQYYSELPEYKAKCNDCSKIFTFLRSTTRLRVHLRRRHSIKIQSRNKKASKKKRSKLWNYFEELKPSLVKCTTCKKEIKVLYLNDRTKIMRAHLLNKHGISLDDDTRTLPDDLKQNYSELPGYKAKCKDCGKTVSFLTNVQNLLHHLRRHSTRILNRDETVMASKRKRSTLWNYFEELNPSLVKCTTCKKELKIPDPTNRTKIMRAHLLNKHGISLDDDTRTLPDDLKQNYSELPGYKAKCNNCSKIFTFLNSTAHLRVHLRTRHSIRIQRRDEPSTSSLADNGMDPSAERQSQDTSGLPVQSFKETTEKTGAFNEPSTSITTNFDTNPTAECQRQETVDLDPQTCEQLKKETRARIGTVIMAPKRKRKLWNYFEQLKPSLVKCTICKKKITIPQPTRRSKIFRAHLLIRHGIFLDNDTLPADLRQYYSELPGHKAKCNDCGKTKSILTNIAHLRKHLRRHSTRILSRDEESWNYFEELKPSLIKCMTCKKEIQIPHQSRLVPIFRAHLSIKHGIFLNNDTFALPDDLRQYYSELPGLKAKCNNCGKTKSFLTNIAPLRKHLRRHSTRILNRDESSTSSSTDHDMDPTNLERQIQEIVDFVLRSEQSRKETRALDGPNTSISMGIDTNPAAECQSQDTSSLPVQSLKEMAEETGALDKPSTSRSADYSMDPPAERQSGELSGLPVQSLKETTEKTDTLDEPSTSSSADYSMDPTAERQSGELSGLPVQSLKETTEKTGTLDEPSTSSSMDYNTNPAAECQSQEIVDLDPQTCEQSRKGTRARDWSVIIAPKKKRSKLWNYFEELKPSLVKCAICKIEIHMPHPSNSTAIMIGHLNRHGIFFNNDTFTLPDDLRKYCSELPGYKAKCNDCGKTMSFLTNIVRLRKHLRRHSTIILSRDEPSTSSLADNGMDPSAERQSQDASGLLVQSFKETTEKTGVLKEPSTSISTGYNIGVTNPTADCQSQETVDLDSQMCEQSRKETRARDRSVIIAPKKKRSKLWDYFEELKSLLVKCAICKIQIYMPHPSHSTAIMIGHLNKHGIFLNNDTFTLPDDLRQYYSELPGYKAKCNDCSKTMPFLTDITRLRKHLRRHSTRILSRDEEAERSRVQE
ncbi:uncharacterized protein [Temnothorax nylanderi]|uniref:uncharacterized protein n=1 Tax=Temnothorax nylanderi TaxID=102681 RepID=UPI003A89B6A5